MLRSRSTRQCNWLATALLACAALCVSPQLLADGEWISMPAGSQYQVFDDGSSHTLPIAIKLTQVKPVDVSFAVVAVRLDSVLAPQLMGAFSVAEKPAEPQPSAKLMMLTVDTAKASRVGNYEVWISASALGIAKAGSAAGDASPEPRTELLKITIEHPAARLRVPPTVPIEIVTGLGTREVTATALKLDLENSPSRLSNLVLGSVRYPATPAVGGSIGLVKSLEDMPRNSSSSYEWTVAGDFPLGTIEATSEIRADQLKDPAAFKLSIKSRRSVGWMFVVIVSGLIVGYGTRVWLATFLQLRKARREGHDVVAAVNEQFARYPDQSLKEALQQPMDALLKAIDKGTAPEITRLATAAREALDKALEEWRKHQREMKAQLDAWLAVVDVKRDGLPVEVANVCSTAAEQLRGAVATLNRSVDAATVQTTAATMALLSDLPRTVEGWQQSIGDALQGLAQPGNLVLPHDVAQVVSERAAVLGTEINAIDSAVGDAKAVEQLLKDIVRLRLQADVSLVQSTKDRLTAFVNAFIQAAGREELEKSGEGAQLRQALDAVQGALSRGTVEERIAALAPGKTPELEVLDELFKRILSKRPQPTGAAEQEELNGFLAARDYVAAANSLRADDGALEAVEFLEEVEEPVRVLVTEMRSAELPSLDSLAAPRPVHVSAAQTDFELWLGNALQTVIVGTLFVLIALGAYTDNFIGTRNELIALFLWAFGVDWTLDKLLDASKVLKAPTARG